jgi:hypothetical protein
LTTHRGLKLLAVPKTPMLSFIFGLGTTTISALIRGTYNIWYL